MRSYKKFTAIPLVLTLGLSACANTGAGYQPVIDGPVGPNYGSDLAQCQNLAAQQGALASNTAGMAAAGAGIAGGTTAVLNNKNNNVRDAVIVGALAGVTAGAVEQNANKESIIKNCMLQRGYNVVG